MFAYFINNNTRKMLKINTLRCLENTQTGRFFNEKRHF